jgi:hypothetical protein
VLCLPTAGSEARCPRRAVQPNDDEDKCIEADG